MTISIHYHAKLYNFLLCVFLGIGFSFVVVSALDETLELKHDQLLGLVEAGFFLALLAESFRFLFSHCADNLLLLPSGCTIETLSGHKVVLSFSSITYFRVWSWKHRVLMYWNYTDSKGKKRQQFVYVSLYNAEPEDVAQLNVYFQQHLGLTRPH